MDTPSIDTKTQPQSAMLWLNSAKEIEKASIRPTPIQVYSTALWETLSERETAVIYKQALGKTWILLKQLIALLFFIALFAIAIIFSIWGIGFALGAALGQDPDNTQKALLERLQSPIQKLVQWADEYVKRYLPWWQSSDTEK